MCWTRPSLTFVAVRLLNVACMAIGNNGERQRYKAAASGARIRTEPKRVLTVGCTLSFADLNAEMDMASSSPAQTGDLGKTR